MNSDFLLDQTGDLVIKNGDFDIGESTFQETQLLLVSKKGEWKAHPLTGANIKQYLKARDGVSDLLSEGRRELINDGLEVKRFKVENNKLNVDTQRNL